jgi:hypothetical protein
MVSIAYHGYSNRCILVDCRGVHLFFGNWGSCVSAVTNSMRFKVRSHCKQRRQQEVSGDDVNQCCVFCTMVILMLVNWVVVVVSLGNRNWIVVGRHRCSSAARFVRIKSGDDSKR